ncbi:MAG: hypothetical protein U1F65_09150 [Verrucomicrobiota bacterium]
MKAPWLILIAGFVPAAPAADGAFVPENPPAMRRLADTNSPAHQAARQFQRGINLGNYLEASPAGWGIIVDDSEFSRMHQEGFDHVRVPVA